MSRIIKTNEQHGQDERRFELEDFTRHPSHSPPARVEKTFEQDILSESGLGGPSWRAAEYQDPSGKLLYRGGERVDLEAREEEAARKAEIENSYQNGYQRGYEEGRDVATAAGEARIAQAVASLTNIAEAIQTFENLCCRHLEAYLLTAIRAVAEKIVKRELQSDPSVVLGMVRAALQSVHDAFEMELVVSPNDFTLMNEREAELLETCQNIKHLSITADDSLQAGDCRVQTTSGDVDARLQTQLDEVLEQIRLGAIFEDDARTPHDDPGAEDQSAPEV